MGLVGSFNVAEEQHQRDIDRFEGKKRDGNSDSQNLWSTTSLTSCA